MTIYVFKTLVLFLCPLSIFSCLPLNVFLVPTWSKGNKSFPENLGYLIWYFVISNICTMEVELKGLFTFYQFWHWKPSLFYIQCTWIVFSPMVSILIILIDITLSTCASSLGHFLICWFTDFYFKKYRSVGPTEKK